MDRISASLINPQQAYQWWLSAWQTIKPLLIAGHRLHVEVRQEKRSDHQNARQHAKIKRLTAEHDALRGVPTELIACLIDARDDVAAELQRCREAAGYPSTDRRLAAQETLIARVDAAIAAAEDHPPAQPVKRMSADEIRATFLSHGFEIKPGFDDLKPYVYAAARAIETECAAAWGVNLEGGV